MKTINFFFAFVLTATFASASPKHLLWTECLTPTNVTVTSQTDSSVTFDWDDCGCDATEYRVFYVKSGQASQEVSTGSSNISFTGLSAGSYRFYIYTVCSGGMSSIIIEEIMMG